VLEVVAEAAVANLHASRVQNSRDEHNTTSKRSCKPCIAQL
jgi:hypothetical protein